jgi:hypothetical protein
LNNGNSHDGDGSGGSKSHGKATDSNQDIDLGSIRVRSKPTGDKKPVTTYLITKLFMKGEKKNIS